MSGADAGGDDGLTRASGFRSSSTKGTRWAEVE